MSQTGVEVDVPGNDVIPDLSSGGKALAPDDENTLESGTRERKLTEKGKLFLVGNCKTLLKSLSKRLDRQIALITPLLISSNRTVVDHEAVQLDRIYTEYTETFAKYGSLLDEESRIKNQEISKGKESFQCYPQNVCPGRIQSK